MACVIKSVWGEDVNKINLFVVALRNMISIVVYQLGNRLAYLVIDNNELVF